MSKVRVSFGLVSFSIGLHPDQNHPSAPRDLHPPIRTFFRQITGGMKIDDRWDGSLCCRLGWSGWVGRSSSLSHWIRGGAEEQRGRRRDRRRRKRRRQEGNMLFTAPQPSSRKSQLSIKVLMTSSEVRNHARTGRSYHSAAAHRQWHRKWMMSFPLEFKFSIQNTWAAYFKVPPCSLRFSKVFLGSLRFSQVSWGSLMSPGSLLGSLNFSQRSNSTRRRRYIEDAELFNIEVSHHSFIINNIIWNSVTKLIMFLLLQVLLAVDYSVLLFHGRDHIQKYLLTLMNIVSLHSFQPCCIVSCWVVSLVTKGAFGSYLN